TTTTSTVWVYADGVVRQRELDPAVLGIPRSEIADLVGGDASTNAGVVRDLVDGREGSVRDVVVLNAAAALVAHDGPVADHLEDQLASGLDRVRTAIDSGAAKQKLATWVEMTRRG
ncbi:MAG: anthranilate phosphoribosyltransferase, partial [Microlunatus sp.]|nr:anthranilate phosphoribosyltransferase [Microlunatus sp.]